MTSFPVLMSNILWLEIIYIFTLVLLEHSGTAELLATSAIRRKGSMPNLSSLRLQMRGSGCWFTALLF